MHNLINHVMRKLTGVSHTPLSQKRTQS